MRDDYSLLEFQLFEEVANLAYLILAEAIRGLIQYQETGIDACPSLNGLIKG
jgi:hypothetical protein